MKYEFHADDCVETKDGQIGYITTFIHSLDFTTSWANPSFFHSSSLLLSV